MAYAGRAAPPERSAHISVPPVVPALLVAACRTYGSGNAPLLGDPALPQTTSPGLPPLASGWQRSRRVLVPTPATTMHKTRPLHDPPGTIRTPFPLHPN